MAVFLAVAAARLFKLDADPFDMILTQRETERCDQP
jgi:hypothetical protein